MVSAIEYVSGDILKSKTEAIVNPVNCVGIMGKGVAKQFKDMFPDNFKAYEAACRHKAVQPGRMFVFETGNLVPPRFIVNFPTKRHWRDKSQIKDIESGLITLVKEILDRKISSVAIPALGCGLGELDWNDVRPLIEGALGVLDEVRVVVYGPQDSDK